jgi:hypothetical protein
MMGETERRWLFVMMTMKEQEQQHNNTDHQPINSFLFRFSLFFIWDGRRNDDWTRTFFITTNAADSIHL